MRIRIYSRPQDRIRNNQIGDWEHNGKVIFIRVLSGIPSDSQLAVAIHELIECVLCRRAGITDQQVCEFDALYEKERERGLHSETAEDGDDPRAPYLKEHQAATDVEIAVCNALGMSWNQHVANCSELPQPAPEKAKDRP